MTTRRPLVATLFIFATLSCGCATTTVSAEADAEWQETADIERCKHLTEGKNRFFILKPGYQIVLASKTEQLAITVLDKTETVNGIATRVVEETEFEDGELKEISRNFFTICKEHGDVFYHGEDVDDYKDGKIVGHGGAWRAGVKGAKAGLIMPAKTPVGLRHYQEIAPKVAMDRAEIVSDSEILELPERHRMPGVRQKYEDCLKVEESSPLEPGTTSLKLYAPRVGMVFDDGLVIVARRSNQKPPEKPIEVNANLGGAYSEVEISADKMPEPVAKKVQELYPKGQIREVKIENRPNKDPFYALEVFVGGEQYDLEIKADGTVLSNKKE